MKKILLSTIVLTAFALSAILFQISCKKEAKAESPTASYSLPKATTTTLGGVIVDGTTIKVDATGKISTVNNLSTASDGIVLYDKEREINNADYDEIWRVNVDGSNNVKVNILLPANVEFEISDGGSYKLTRDSKKIIFQAHNKSTNKDELYSCNIDGTQVTRIVEDQQLQLGSVN